MTFGDAKLIPENAIEARHLETIASLGLDPAFFLFEAQFQRQYRNQGSAAALELIRAARAWTPSRFELVELLHYYYLASLDVAKMREMASDIQPLPDVPFVIASDPAQTIGSDVIDHSEDVVDLPGGVRHVVWIRVGLMNHFMYLARDIVRTLVRPVGHLQALLDSITAAEGDPRPLIEALLDAGEPDDPFLDYSRPLDLGSDQATLGVALDSIRRTMVTFVAGHEMGHVYLGQTPSHPRLSVFQGRVPGKSTFERDHLQREVEADAVGLVSVWDGAANSHPQFALSIDHGWIGPVIFLASMARRIDPELDHAAAEWETEKWTHRLHVFIRLLARELRRTGIEPERSRRITVCAPMLAAAVVEWRRLRSSEKTEIDLTPYHDLREAMAAAQ